MNWGAVESGTHRMTLAKGLAHHLKACWFADKLPTGTGRQEIRDQLLAVPKLLKAGVPPGMDFRVKYNSS